MLFKSITKFCGTDNTMWNIPTFKLHVRNIMQVIVNPTKLCYGSE